MLKSTLALFNRNLRAFSYKSIGNYKRIISKPSIFALYKITSRFSTQNDPEIFENFLYDINELIKKSDFDRAIEKCQQQLIELYEMNMQNSLKAVVFHNYLGQLYQMLGKLSDADDQFLKAAEIAENSNNEEIQKQVGDLYHHRAMVAQQLGDYQKCIKYFHVASDKYLKHFEDDYEKRADVHISLGKNYLYQDDIENGRIHLLEALDLLTNIYQMDDPNMGLLHLQLGFLFEKEGSIQYAIEYKEKGVALCIKKYGENNIKMASIYPSLGDLYEGLKMYPEALEYYEKAYNLLKDTNEKQFNRDQVRILCHIGNVHWHLENLDNAYDIFKKCITLFESYGGGEEAILGTLYNNLGTVCNKMGRFGESIKFFKDSIFLRTNIFGSDHLEVGYTYKNIGKAYAANEQFEDAKLATEKALLILSKHLGHNHSECADLRDLIELYDRLSKNE